MGAHITKLRVSPYTNGRGHDKGNDISPYETGIDGTIGIHLATDEGLDCSSLGESGIVFFLDGLIKFIISCYILTC